jgi:HEAT repeat protein
MPPRLVKCLSRLAAFLRTRGAIVVLILLVAFLAGTALFLRGEPEPSYNHIPASDWLELVSTNQQPMAEVITAFSHMGPAGGAFLGHELLSKPNQIDAWLLAHHQQIPGPLKKYLLKPQRQFKGDNILTILAGIGTNATPAVPALITWLEDQSMVAYTPPPRATNTSIVMLSRTLITSSNGVLRTNNILYRPSNTNNIPFLLSNGFTTTVSGFPQSTPPQNLTTQKQVIVSAPGLVITNVTILVKSAQRPLPRAAFQILTNFGSDDPRVISLLLNPVDATIYSSRSSSAKPVYFGSNLRLAALRSIPLLAKSAADRDPRRQWLALSLLRLTLPQSTVARDLMISKLGTPDPALFDFAIESLQTTTNELDRIVPLAIQALKRFRNRTTDLFGDWQPPVYLALEEFSHHSPLVIPQLQELLPRADFYEQIGILQLLRKIGTTNTVDLQQIETFTRHHDPAIRAAAWFALGKIKEDKVAEASGHITLLAGGGDHITWAAYQRLGELGAASQAAVPELIRHLKLPDLRKVQKAAETLGKIGPAAEPALAPLRALQDHPDDEIRLTVAAAIRQITSEPK